MGVGNAMSWIERLNRVPGRVPLSIGNGNVLADVLHWAYSPHLPDNVPHRHTYFEVCLVGEHGAGEYHVDGRPHAIRAGDLFIARPGVVHQIINRETPWMELYWVAFALDGLAGDRMLTDFAGARDVLVVPDEGGRIAATWRALRVAAECAPVGGDPGLLLLMGALLRSIAQSGSAAVPETGLPEEGDPPRGPVSAPVREAIAYIQEHLGRRTLTVADIADFVHLSPRQVTRLFVAFTGVAPSAYVERARLDRARALLLRTDDPLKQIALLVGYGDIHHFTRAFSRRFGCPPGRFRETRGAADTTPQGEMIPTPGMLV